MHIVKKHTKAFLYKKEFTRSGLFICLGGSIMSEKNEYYEIDDENNSITFNKGYETTRRGEKAYDVFIPTLTPGSKVIFSKFKYAKHTPGKRGIKEFYEVTFGTVQEVVSNGYTSLDKEKDFCPDGHIRMDSWDKLNIEYNAKCDALDEKHYDEYVAFSTEESKDGNDYYVGIKLDNTISAKEYTEYVTVESWETGSIIYG